MAQQAFAGLDILMRAYIEKTGITSEVEGSTTSPMPPGWPLDRSFVRLLSGMEWDYANGYAHLHLERTAPEVLTWHHYFPDNYNRQNYSPMVFAAEAVLLATPPRSIQQVSKAIDFTPNGARVLTSALAQAVDPARALLFFNTRIMTTSNGYQTVVPEITGPNELSWKVTTYNCAASKTLRALIIDPN
jgi:hypothetical protein